MGGSLEFGNVVVAVFPFSDFSRYKRRPALILARAEFGDYILCQITSAQDTSRRALLLQKIDFTQGSLPRDSYIRPDKIFTADKSTILYTAGRISDTKIGDVKKVLAEIFKIS